MKKTKKNHGLALEEILKALGDPVRLSIVRQLLESKEEMACGTFNYSVTKATFSHHIKILMDAGIIKRREDGTRKFMSIDEEFKKEFRDLMTLVAASR